MGGSLPIASLLGMDDLLVHWQGPSLDTGDCQELVHVSHRTHSYPMIGLLAVGAALFFSGGPGGGALFLLWPLVCMGMMAAMMFGMGGMSRRPEHT